MVKLDGLNRNSKEISGSTNTASSSGSNSQVSWSSKLLVVLIVVVALAVIASIGIGVFASENDSTVKKDRYQAVFLDNGQVYFGRLRNINEAYVTLTDIYYLQVNQQVQPEQDGDDDTQQQPQVTLTKLGGELHGPEDAMFIDRSKIVFWENLKSEGQVTQKIQEEKSQ